MAAGREGGEAGEGKPLGLVSMTHQHTIDKSQKYFLDVLPSGPALGQDTALISPGAQDSNAI